MINSNKSKSTIKEPNCYGCGDGLEIANSNALNYLQNLLGSCSKGDRFQINYGAYCGNGNALHVFCYKMMLPQQPDADYNPNKMYGPDVPPYYIGKSPSFASNWLEIEKFIDLLVTKVSSLKETDGFFQQSALNAAIAYDNTPAALALIKIISKDNVLSNELFNTLSANKTFGATPLLLSIQRANLQVFSALIKSKLIDVNVRDNFGLSPLHWAIIMGLPEMVEALLIAGANPNAKTNEGKTALDYLNITNKCESAEFRPILAHFWDNRELFMQLRNEKIKIAKERIHTLISETNPTMKEKVTTLLQEMFAKEITLAQAQTIAASAVEQQSLEENMSRITTLAFNLNMDVKKLVENAHKSITPQFDNSNIISNKKSPQAQKAPVTTMEQQIVNASKDFFGDELTALRIAELLVQVNGNISLANHINQLSTLMTNSDFDNKKVVENLERRKDNRNKI